LWLYYFFNLDSRWWYVITMFSPLNPWERDTLSILQEAGWATKQVWTGAEKLAFTGIRFSYRLARTESLFRLSYQGPLHFWAFVNVCLHERKFQNGGQRDPRELTGSQIQVVKTRSVI
jgi:hypothetical protein